MVFLSTPTIFASSERQERVTLIDPPTNYDEMMVLDFVLDHYFGKHLEVDIHFQGQQPNILRILQRGVLPRSSSPSSIDVLYLFKLSLDKQDEPYPEDLIGMERVYHEIELLTYLSLKVLGLNGKVRNSNISQ